MIRQLCYYKRHDRTTLFAALNVTGKVVGRHKIRRRRIEFLDLINTAVGEDPDREIRVVLHNLSTHKPKRDVRLARHPNIHFHHTPTHTSGLNHIDIWFSILSGKSLKGASFQSVDQLKAHIEAFVADYNKDARPFAWTKSEVHQKRLKPCFAEWSWVLAPVSKPRHRRRTSPRERQAPLRPISML